MRSTATSLAGPVAPAALAAVVLWAAAAPAEAKPPSVYINGVKVDGLTDETFKNVDVAFDAEGNVRITARGYKIAVEDADAAGPDSKTLRTTTEAHHAAAAQGSRFFIATHQPRTGAAQWEIDLYVNQVFVKKFRSKEPEPVTEITRFLKPGPNVVHFSAKKEPYEQGQRISTSPTDYIELTIGDGEMRAGQVMLNRIATYKRTAAETGTRESDTTITLQQAAP